LGEHETAAIAYEEAAMLTKNDDTKARYLASAAANYAYAGAKEQALATVEKIKKEVPESEYRQLILIEAMREFARAGKDEQLQIALLEQWVELRPGDSAKRFELAYSHSDNDNGDMALYHYIKIPVGERNPITWNNLGVSYGEFGMPVEAVTAMQISANENEALAMSNLGFKLLSAGFVNEAKEFCDRALALRKYPTNVPDLARRIIEAPDEENKKLNEALEKVTTKASFYRKLGAAVLKTAPTVIGPQWKAPEGILHAAIDKNSLTLIGTFDRPSNPFSGMLGSSLGLPAPTAKVVTHRVIFVGEIRGNVVIGQVKRTQEGATTLASEAMDARKVLMFFNEDHSELFAMENPESLSPRFYSLTRAN
jgi:tetratricopeptide (TPR) repeat protein